MADGRATLGDGLAAGAAGAVLGGVPSTVHALLVTGKPLEAVLAAGSLLLREDERQGRLLLAALPVHLAVSLAWGLVLAATLPRRRTVASGLTAGLAIAAFDLGVIGRRFPRVRALPLLPQVADHLAYAGSAAAVVTYRRARRRRRRAS